MLLLVDWFAENKLSINVSKTNYMLFKTRAIQSGLPTLLLDGRPIARVLTTKFLRVVIDDKLTWKDHVTAVERKLSVANFIIRKIRFKINQNTAMKLYDTLVLRHIMYCNIVWGNTCKSYTANISRLQKRALKLCREGRINYSENLFSLTKRLPFTKIHTMQTAQLVYSFFQNSQAVPKCIMSLFDKISEIHHHNTRSLDDMCLFTHYGRLNIRKNSVKICAPTILNQIPSKTRKAVSICCFKKELKLKLFNDL